MIYRDDKIFIENHAKYTTYTFFPTALRSFVIDVRPRKYNLFNFYQHVKFNWVRGKYAYHCER
jgi:hypothetical protein